MYMHIYIYVHSIDQIQIFSYVIYIYILSIGWSTSCPVIDQEVVGRSINARSPGRHSWAFLGNEQSTTKVSSQ